MIAEPLLTFGIITDIQYADIPDGHNHAKTKKRHYRKTLQDLKGAIETWKQSSPQIEFIVQMGDIIDGYNTHDNKSLSSLNQVIQEFDKIDIRKHHMIGNHELYNFNREQLKEYLKIENNYYSFIPVKGYKFIILDSFDECMICPASGKKEDHHEFLKENNINIKKDLIDWYEGIPKERQNLVPYNGAIGKEQLLWLKNELKCQEKVLIFSHLPLHHKSSKYLCLHWNYQDILEIVEKSNNVVACFAGHDHEGGYHFSEQNIHFITIESSLERQENCFGIIEIHQNVIKLKGFGAVQSRDIIIRN